MDKVEIQNKINELEKTFEDASNQITNLENAKQQIIGRVAVYQELLDSLPPEEKEVETKD